MTPDELRTMLNKPAVARVNPALIAARLPSANTQSTEGKPLDGAAPGESSSGNSVARRFEIVFTIYAVRPCDWDGYHIKEIQDWLVELDLLPGDSWEILRGQVIPEKVHTKKEERTVIEIWEL